MAEGLDAKTYQAVGIEMVMMMRPWLLPPPRLRMMRPRLRQLRLSCSIDFGWEIDCLLHLSLASLQRDVFVVAADETSLVDFFYLLRLSRKRTSCAVVQLEYLCGMAR